MLTAASIIPRAEIISAINTSGVIGTMEIISAMCLVIKCFLLPVRVNLTK